MEVVASSGLFQLIPEVNHLVTLCGLSSLLSEMGWWGIPWDSFHSPSYSGYRQPSLARSWFFLLTSAWSAFPPRPACWHPPRVIKGQPEIFLSLWLGLHSFLCSWDLGPSPVACVSLEFLFWVFSWTVGCLRVRAMSRFHFNSQMFGILSKYLDKHINLWCCQGFMFPRSISPCLYLIKIVRVCCMCFKKRPNKISLSQRLIYGVIRKALASNFGSVQVEQCS